MQARPIACHWCSTEAKGKAKGRLLHLQRKVTMSKEDHHAQMEGWELPCSPEHTLAQ